MLGYLIKGNVIARVRIFYQTCSCYHSKSGVYGHRPKPVQSPFQVDDTHKANRNANSNVFRLVEAYRTYGHRKATIDPLGLQQVIDQAELAPERYGLSPSSQQTIDVAGLFYSATGNQMMTVDELIVRLEKEYCDTIGAEFQHLQSEAEREWFAKAFEKKNDVSISNHRKIDLANLMLKCQAFDHFLAAKFTTLKRYGGEGGESMMAVFDEIFRKCAQGGVDNVVICMPHRGRLNFLTCMLNFPPVRIFQKVSGISEIPPGFKGTGDVVSHLYTSSDLTYEGKDLHVSFIPNPSHLEANNPVAVGKCRSKQQTLQEGDYSSHGDSQQGDRTLCLQVHGDASFSAQGIVAETFSIAECPHYNTGGSVHFIVNNQIGFTTEASRGRSSTYSSDLAKINGYPVLHVNADFPEDVVKATSIAMQYRQKFRKDVIIDFICYRKYGHNELDDPSFTQPIMYNAIRNRKSIPDSYAEQLKGTGVCTDADISAVQQNWSKFLHDNFAAMNSQLVEPYVFKNQWAGYRQAPGAITRWDTGVAIDTLKYVGAKSVSLPKDFNVHPTIGKNHCDKRVQRMTEGSGLDWAAAEALAFGSLMHEGFNVRISGQDVGRGTFSHRHAMLVDQVTDEIYVPLNHMTENQAGFLEVANSALSEEAVLGYEYGMSIDSPRTLVIWEAQFGDFFNGAQPIIDTYITSGENKWLLQTGLVMLLPHGMDGAGPEHSSCRVERFLQACDSSETTVDGDDVNIQILNPTTPAQYFHLLRRQMIRNYRKPLVVVAPKVLLRLPAASSSLAEMAPGTTFLPVIGESASVNGENVRRVVFCSGKHFYLLQKEREARKVQDMALIRLESLCPFPTAELQAELAKFPNAKEFIWAQEEHRNMGAWSFVAPRFENLVGCKLKYVGRDVLGLPAVGIGSIHKVEAEKLVTDLYQ
ncbi:2-oxoadipate dehydrogenase complex component E1-like isoform X2 [Dreissena polymorpha]|uniref:2-oxoadipate dehydrogenase complex component E1-like isoform X2 n=1 Tax=Dreissena polymorpha TaxID=45954 RepID=UPI0022654447|nr:2-oxoadipate dehydrogenase complex component E1-like isoform X2 [Dreissena polymorpha]